MSNLYAPGGELAGYRQITSLDQGEILLLQQFLYDLKYNPGTIDGVWGPATKAAWDLFRENNGIEGDMHLAPEQVEQVFRNGERANLIEGPGVDIDPMDGMSGHDGGGEGTAGGSGPPPADSADSGSGYGDGILDEEELKKLRQDYPTLAHLLDEPEIGDLLRQAVEEGWPLAQLVARMEGTTWWQTTTASQRTFDSSISRDPASIEQQIQDQMLTLANTFQSFGMDVHHSELRDMAYNILRNGTSESAVLRMVGDQARATMRAGSDGPGGDAQGQLASLVQDLQAQARAYHLAFHTDQLEEWAVQITEGRWTMDAAEATMRRQASQAYPQLADSIAQGSTVEQYFAPMKNHLARTLDMNPDAIDLTEDRWADITNFVDDNGNVRPMSFSEIGRYARKQDEWWETDAAHQKGYGVLNGLLKTFGAIK